ncbi:MAG: haloacid dehalogenase-like hydrolase [Clostridiales bacterium]|nr:haloacid dehalogenase-like hydrolase [Clostridiales bacterium]
MLIVSTCYVLDLGYKQKPAESKGATTVANSADMLSLWSDDAAAKKELIDYVKAVSNQGTSDYIPLENRIAVFDLDGTLACETDPVYFDHCLLKYRVLDDPDYKDKASDFEIEVAKEVAEYMETGVSPSDMMTRHGKAVASAFSGLTPEEFVNYAAEFAKTPAPGYNGMTRGEAFYKPMLEVVNLLEKYDFTVYIVSGTDRFIVRGLITSSPLDIPANQIIGSDDSLVATDQGDTDGLEYVFDDDDQLVMGGEFLVKNLDMNKVTVIQQEIGKQPVLAFGNSGSDFSMAQYALNNNPYPAKAFMLCCDDTVRENGKPEKAEKMVASCAENGFTPISMKNDWKTIYGDSVTRKEADADTQSNLPPLIINSEPFVVTAKDGFENAGVTGFVCDATETYSFTSSSEKTTWSVFVLDKEFEDGARYLPQAETPALEGDGTLTIEEGKIIYILCSESGFTADAPSSATLSINYAE